MSSFTTTRTEEECHWFDVMRTFMLYGDFLDMEIHRRQTHINALNKFQYSKLPALTFERIGAAQQALQRNQEVFENIVGFYQETTQDWRDRAGKDIPHSSGTGVSRNLVDPRDGPSISLQQQHRCDAVLHSMNREWGEHGLVERQVCVCVCVCLSLSLCESLSFSHTNPRSQPSPPPLPPSAYIRANHRRTSASLTSACRWQ